MLLATITMGRGAPRVPAASQNPLEAVRRESADIVVVVVVEVVEVVILLDLTAIDLERPQRPAPARDDRELLVAHGGGLPENEALRRE